MSMSEEVEVRVQPAPYASGIHIYVRCKDLYAETVELKRKEEGEYIAPAIRLSRKSAQLLIDDLWSSGYRPTEGTGSAGALRATEKHLEDMRTLVFKYVNIQRD